MRTPSADSSPDRLYYDPVIQTLPLEKIRQLQDERLRKQLDRIWKQPIPFFRRKLEEAGFRAAAALSARRP
jgi:phenylacetate-coenzyme A ligase PaaK-like adenylate-forming protein